jgi:hypothetical protein
MAYLAYPVKMALIERLLLFTLPELGSLSLAPRH